MTTQHLKSLGMKAFTAFLWLIVGLGIFIIIALASSHFDTPQTDERFVAGSTTPIVPPPASVAICTKLQPAAVEQVRRFNEVEQPKWTDGNLFYARGMHLNREELYKVFYSPGLDTCIKVVISRFYRQEGHDWILVDEDYDFYNAFPEMNNDLVDFIHHIQLGETFYSVAEVQRKILAFETATSSPVNPSLPL